MLWIGLVVLLILVLAGLLWGPIASNVEQAKYSVIEHQGALEIRDYASAIVAETETTGERKEAIKAGFRTIADYIFGNNTAQAKVAMTAPVTQQSSEKIAMTAPVTQQTNGSSWRVRFVMPAQYTLDTLPKPNNPAVKLESMPAKRFAAVRFSGCVTDETIQEKTALLRRFIAEKNLMAVADPVYAFFNPPWTLPFLRRNEIMIEVAQ